MNDHPALKQVLLSDTTLRDGEQMVGAALQPHQKVAIASALAKAGVNSIEAGFPACSASEVESIRAIVEQVQGPIIVALCRAVARDIEAAQAAFERANPFRCGVNIFLATSPLHRDAKLRKSKREIVAMIVSSIAQARKSFRFVSFSPEDASRTEPEFLCEVVREAIDAGATSVAFPDTVGILTPEKTRSFLRRIQEEVPNLSKALLAVHFHDDLGLATANTLAAIEEGARIAQCTVNGIGERAGNAALEEVALVLSLHPEQYGCRHSVKLDQLTALSRLVAQETAISVPPNKAVVGPGVFTTEAGVHQDGLLKHAGTYLPFAPALVGADGYRLVIGKHSGRAAISARLRELGYLFPAETVDRIAEKIAELAESKITNEEALLREAVARVSGAGAATLR